MQTRMSTTATDANSTASEEISYKISFREKLSFGAGDFACNLSWNFISGFLLFFFTNVALLPAAAVGTLLLLARGLDSFIDPVLGVVVDKTSTRFGKTRPYLLFGSIPFGLLVGLVFWSPNASLGVKLAYAYVTLIVIGLVFSAVNIPYSALMPLMTRSSAEKMKLGSFRGIGSSVGSMLVAGCTLPLVKLLGAGDQRRGFAFTAFAFGAISTILLLITFVNCRERFKDEFAEGNIKLSTAVANMLRNPHWRVVFIFITVTLCRLGAAIAVTIYFCLYVLHKPWAVSILLPLISAASIVGAIVAPPWFRQFGIRKGNLLGMAISIVLYAMLPLLEQHFVPFVVVYAIACIATGICTVSLFAMGADTVDYQQWRFGARNDGLIFSCISLGTKIGMAVGTAIIAYALALAHFNPQLVTPSAYTTIRWLYYGGPIFFIILQMTCVSQYDLEKIHPQIVRELAARSVANVDPRELGRLAAE